VASVHGIINATELYVLENVGHTKISNVKATPRKLNAIEELVNGWPYFNGAYALTYIPIAKT